MTKPVTQAEYERKLGEICAEFHDDPLGYVGWAFPWGTGDLATEEVEKWQKEVLAFIRDELRWQKNIDVVELIRIAVGSGHGIGKSALISWLILWYMSTRKNPEIIVTANTGSQLRTKTWKRLAEWQKRAINGHWFEWTAESFRLKGKDSKGQWYASAITWSEGNSQSFAGAHGKNVMFLLDEASEIPEIIYDVIEGAFSDAVQGGTKLFLVFGNCTSNIGRFKECIAGKFRHRWQRWQIDSRDVKRTDKKKIAEDIADYGEDSDFVRVRWKGQFPRSAANQFIPEDIVDTAINRVYLAHAYAEPANICGVDIARSGDDSSCTIIRKGVIAYDLRRMKGFDTTQMYQVCKDILMRGLDERDPNEIRDWDRYVDHMFIDMGNTGAAVLDLLWRHEAFRSRLTGVWFGAPDPEEPERWKNTRAGMWGRMREWLRTVGCIPNDNDLKSDLISPKFFLTEKDQVQLEKKENMEVSPDAADALCLTHYETVIRYKIPILEQSRHNNRNMKKYDPMKRAGLRGR